MIEGYFPIRKGDGLWDYIELEFDLYAAYMTVTEMRRNPRTEAELHGRTITIHDTAKILQLLGIKSQGQFEDRIEELIQTSKFDIDYLQRRCEYHNIGYEITGSRLQTVWRNHIKACKIKFEQAKAFFQGKESEFDDEYDAMEVVLEATDIKLPEAYGFAAKYYADNKDWSEVLWYADRGVKLKDGLSMYVFALYHIEWGRKDCLVAAAWCVKAAEKGIPEAVELLNRLVKEGKVDADSVPYSSLLSNYARKN